MKKDIKVALIGAGARAKSIYKSTLKYKDNLQYVAVCDIVEDSATELANSIKEDKNQVATIYTDYKKCIDESKPDVAIISTAWVGHIGISIYALEHHVATASEIGCGYTIDELWDLVKCYERTGTPFMPLENCCYGRLELLALNMKNLGLLGEIVHCECGYRHYLSDLFLNGGEKFRFEEYQKRNTENYPTHGIGPLSKLLDINTGNRFVSLVSVGSKARGINAAAHRMDKPEYEHYPITQSDVVTTILKCQNGETVSMHLDTTLPRWYSRDYLVQGTEGVICENNQSVFLKSEFPEEMWVWKDNFNNIDKYYEKYEHDIWKGFTPGEEGHGGMDTLEFRAFFDALENDKPMPIDVYDFATWHAISVLSEQSLTTGATVYFPDFTNGKWITRKNNFK